MSKPNHNRGAVKKSAATLVAVWIPHELATALDAAVNREDSDRSKIVRKALRRHLTQTA